MRWIPSFDNCTQQKFLYLIGHNFGGQNFWWAEVSAENACPPKFGIEFYLTVIRFSIMLFTIRWNKDCCGQSFRLTNISADEIFGTKPRFSALFSAEILSNKVACLKAIFSTHVCKWVHVDQLSICLSVFLTECLSLFWICRALRSVPSVDISLLSVLFRLPMMAERIAGRFST